MLFWYFFLFFLAFRRQWEEFIMSVFNGAVLFFFVRMVNNLCSYLRQIYYPLCEFL